MVLCTFIDIEGSNYGFHVCDCFYDSEGCIDPTISERCNCDANLPIPLTDSGTMTNTTALPIMKLFFGGLDFDMGISNWSSEVLRLLKI